MLKTIRERAYGDAPNTPDKANVSKEHLKSADLYEYMGAMQSSAKKQVRERGGGVTSRRATNLATNVD